MLFHCPSQYFKGCTQELADGHRQHICNSCRSAKYLYFLGLNFAGSHCHGFNPNWKPLVLLHATLYNIVWILG